jgi:8-oxo-dGTP pyrophosphatase MutT (NUDIX family)
MNLNLYIPTLLDLLSSYKPVNKREADHRERMVNFVNTSSAPFSRQNSPGHLTVSAVLADQSITHVLFLWHEKLQRWLQPGGHCEERVDRTTQDAAFRELREETGIDRSEASLLQNGPIDLDIHVIPASHDEGEHLHYDLRYAFILEKCPDSSRYQWRSISDIVAFEDESIARFARKISELARQKS